jgi:hypothetical protein
MTRTEQAVAFYDLHNTKFKLFLTGFFQVIFVAMNTVFIAHYFLWANAITAFMISLIWTFNVKKIAFGGVADQWVYATGAMIGSVLGNILATGLIK